MKKILKFVCSALALMVLAGCAKSTEGKFTLGLDASFPPMGYTEEDGSITGYDIDLAKEVSRRLNLDFSAKPIDWDAKEMELSTGNIDCIWNGLSLSEERQAAMNCTLPYLNNDQVLVVRNDSEIKSIADAKGKIVGIQAGSTAEEAVNDNKEFAASLKELKTYPDNLVALADLELGGLDAVVMDSVVANWTIKTGNKPLVVIEEALAKEAYGIAFRKDEKGAELRDKVWATLEEMAKDGTIAKISTDWFGSDISVISK